MKNGLFFIFPLQVFMFLSCTTITSTYNKDTSNLPVRAEGRMVMADDFHKASGEDISADGRFLLISSDKGDPPDSDNAVYFVQWEGNLRYKEGSCPVRVEYRQSNNNNRSLISIDVKKTPPLYEFEHMEFSEFDYFGQKKSSSVSQDVMPLDIASFKINDREFVLQITYFESFALGKKPKTSVLSLISNDKQVFSMLDKQGTLYAEFSRDSYKIYDSDMLVDDIWPAIAMFALIQEIGIVRNAL